MQNNNIFGNNYNLTTMLCIYEVHTYIIYKKKEKKENLTAALTHTFVFSNKITIRYYIIKVL